MLISSESQEITLRCWSNNFFIFFLNFTKRNQLNSWKWTDHNGEDHNVQVDGREDEAEMSPGVPSTAPPPN